jgi:hypothetical protein
MGAPLPPPNTQVSGSPEYRTVFTVPTAPPQVASAKSTPKWGMNCDVLPPELRGKASEVNQISCIRNMSMLEYEEGHRFRSTTPTTALPPEVTLQWHGRMTG